MAKIRVYELAKDLNMTNTALLNKMKELKIEVKSHMSSLEDSDIRAIKRNLFGREKGKNEVKVKPSVIRRRRSPLDETAETEGDIALASEEDTPPEGVPTTREETPKVPAMTPSPKSPKAEPKKDKPGIKKIEPARIIRPAVIEPPVSATPADSVRTPEQDPIVSEIETGKKTDAALEPNAEEMSPNLTHMEKTVLRDENLSENQSEFVENETTATETDSLNIDDRDEKAKKKKKKKKTTPAKIVKIADPIVLENLRKPAPVEDKKRPSPRIDSRTESPRKKPFVVKDPLSTSFNGIPEKEIPLSDIIKPDEIDAGKWKKEKKPAIDRKSTR